MEEGEGRRCLLADPFPLCAKGLQGTMSHWDWCVVEQAGVCLHACQSQYFDLVVMECVCPQEGDGITVLEEINCPVVFLSFVTCYTWQARAYALGARGWIDKRDQDIPGKLTRAMEGDIWSNDQKRSMRGQLSRPGCVAGNLTRRQTQVLRLMCLGLTNKEIAKILGVDRRKVQHIQERVRERVSGCGNTNKLTAWANAHGLGPTGWTGQPKLLGTQQ